MQTPKPTWRDLRDSPGWLFLIILLALIPTVVISNMVLLNNEMGGWALAWVVALGTLFIWLSAWRERPGQLTNSSGAEPPPGERPWWVDYRFKPRLLGFVGGVLFSIIGYYVALRADMAPPNAANQLGHWLWIASQVTFAGLMVAAIVGTYLARRAKK